MKRTGGGVTLAIIRSHRWATAVSAAFLAGGCDAVVLNPKGPIADAERGLLFDAFSVMLIVVVPVIVMAFLFAWRYRASNRNARYEPTWANSARIDAVVWLVPALIVIAVGVLVWRSTHKLDPYREIASNVPPLDIQVVAQDWKWLFIYPEQGIAVVNQMAIPSGRPISLRITSDTVMNSFYVPALAGQIYAMAGMQTRLQMLADAPGSSSAATRSTAAAASPTSISRCWPPRRRISTPGWPRPSRRPTSSTPPPTPSLPRRAGSFRSPTIRRSSPGSSIRSSPSTPTATRRQAGSPPPAEPARR